MLRPIRRLRAARAAIAAIALALATLGFAAPAQAAPSGIEFSTDGVTFTPIFTGSLFRDITLVVPGDTQTSTFWVRNAAASAGYLRVVLADVTATSPIIANAITITSSTPSHPGSATPLSRAAPCWVLNEGDLIPAGGSVKITSTVTLGNLNGMEGQGESAGLSIRVGLSDAAVGSLPPTSCGGTTTTIPASGSSAVIAMTGSEFPYPLLTFGAGALGVGLFLLIAARRRRREDA